MKTSVIENTFQKAKSPRLPNRWFVIPTIHLMETNELYEILKRLNEHEKITIIMISHDINSLNYVNKVLRTGEDVYLLDVKEYKRRLDNGTI